MLVAASALSIWLFYKGYKTSEISKPSLAASKNFDSKKLTDFLVKRYQTKVPYLGSIRLFEQKAQSADEVGKINSALGMADTLLLLKGILGVALCRSHFNSELMIKSINNLLNEAENEENIPVRQELVKWTKINIDWVKEKDSLNAETFVMAAAHAYLFERGVNPMAPVLNLRKALKLDSNNINANIFMVNLLVESQQFEKAIQRGQKLISLQPENPMFYFNLSDIYGNIGNREKSLEYRKLGEKLNK